MCEKINEDRFQEDYVLLLDRNVLVVATVNKKQSGYESAEWCAYIGATKDISEWEIVKKQGTKIPKAVADVLFPFSKTHRWRY